MELAPGVYDFPQTVEQNGVENTIHPAAVETTKGIILVDTGYEGLTDQLEANLGEAGYGWADVTAVVISHQDSDHAGSLSEVVDRTDAIVYAHQNAVPYIDGRKHPIKSPEGERYPPVDVDVEVVDGVSFRTNAGPMNVVFTPGHAPGHIALHFPDARVLLAADALTADENGIAGPSEQYTPEMDRALESAQQFTELAIDRTLCYHGGLVEHGADRIAEVVAAGQQ